MLSKHFQAVKAVIQDSLKQANRAEGEVTVVAVTKYFDVEMTKQIVSHGFTHLGENRVESLLLKQGEMQGFPVKWHFIGNLQRRKVKKVINSIDYFHALDSIKLAEEIQKHREYPLDCFVEVNVSGEESKFGIQPEELDSFLQNIERLDKVQVIGLMTMAPLGANEKELHQYFSTIKKMQLAYSKKYAFASLTDISAGMSNDFPIALEEGATYIRIGSLFKNNEEDFDGVIR
ncbi:MAG: YggS family pyridoxal phosphate-dependent enzyme [Streptococcaceae bacterium]|nr:YggS family pyridoxal phosphate-dependent enzyme [Streptococcaceae bacterium]